MMSPLLKDSPYAAAQILSSVAQIPQLRHVVVQLVDSGILVTQVSAPRIKESVQTPVQVAALIACLAAITSVYAASTAA